MMQPRESSNANAILGAMMRTCPVPHSRSCVYRGAHELLMLWGVGRPGYQDIVNRHVASGRHAVMWDLGYLGRSKVSGHMRLSIDAWHPQSWLDRTEPDPSRFDRLGVEVSDQYDPQGHIVLVGMGPKSHAFLGSHGWEARKLEDLRRRFDGREIVFRPKPGKPVPDVACVHDERPLDDVLKGASLVVCRHSNVAVDAVIRGIPIEVEDGAAKWIEGKPYNQATRLDFLHRLAWWQWRASEASDAWRFIKKVIS